MKCDQWGQIVRERVAERAVKNQCWAVKLTNRFAVCVCTSRHCSTHTINSGHRALTNWMVV